jgi:predicted amidophosphoribosyltransferase
MRNPLRPEGPDVCEVCLTFTDGFRTCYRCGHDRRFLDAVLPVSYSVHFGQLHTALYGYKRRIDLVASRFQLELAAVLWRFLNRHERCLATRTGAQGFRLVTTVPSGSAERDEAHPLRRIVAVLARPTADRYEAVLRRSTAPVPERTVNPNKFDVTRRFRGEPVLLIDDTWTTGASAQSAAGALKAAGAGVVALVVIGRHVHDDYADNSARLRALPRRFDWTTCAFE